VKDPSAGLSNPALDYRRGAALYALTLSANASTKRCHTNSNKEKLI
jgi:hypothetical protein